MAILIVVLFTIFSVLFNFVYETISCYIVIPRRIKKIMEKQGVRGPEPRPFTGNMSEMASLISESTSADMDHIHHDTVRRLLPHYVAWSEQYGKRFMYWHGVEPRMCLSEPELIKEFLSKYSTKAGKSWLQRQGSKHFIGRGLLMANGKDWLHQRRMVAPAFTRERLKTYSSDMVECTEKMLQSLQKAVEAGRQEVDISEHMTKLTSEIISRTEFGGSHEKGKEIFHLLTDLQRLCAQASRHLCFPGSRFFPSKYNRKIRSLKMEVEHLLEEIIQLRKGCVELRRVGSYGNDLLGMILNEIPGKPNGLGSNMQLIMDECKTFFFAGHETTALLLTWACMLLATNPSWQEVVRAEVSHVFNGAAPSVDHLSKLSVLNMVINETLRLYPPATLLPRMAFEDIKLGDLLIPKGLSIWVPVLALHHDKDLWGENANEFNPSRFSATSFPLGTGKYFMPFAACPRNCIGQSYAMMEAKIILAMLVSRFSFTISDNYRHAPVTVLTIKPKHGVQICLKPLNPPSKHDRVVLCL